MALAEEEAKIVEIRRHVGNFNDGMDAVERKKEYEDLAEVFKSDLPAV